MFSVFLKQIRVELITALSRIAVVLALTTTPCTAHASRSDNEVRLHYVRKIFLRIENNDQTNEKARSSLKLLPTVLKEALENRGFMIVDGLAEADAILDGETEEWITLDGPQPEPPKYRFRFRLSSSKYKVKWQTEFNIRSVTDESEVGNEATLKLAQNLFKAWKKSATMAGIIVRDRIP